MEPLLKTKDLKKYFKVNSGLLHAVDGVNIEIKEGQTLGVVGESGCGKSTLGRVVLRLLEATSGEVLFQGENILKYDRQEMQNIRRQMQIIFQDPFSSLNPRMSVFDLIAEPLVMNHIYKNSREMTEKILSLMETVGLAERFVNTYPHEMDGGRRQRVGVARALALSPKFIVCDEPVSALDVSIQAQILNLLMDLQEEMKLTYMFITHDLSVVKHISNEIAVMYLGQCVERAESKELFKNPMHPYTKALLSAIPVPRLTGKKERKIIRGEVSDPINPKPGCRFASRCDYCTDNCLGQDIPLKDQGNGHFVACRLYP
ncbi:ABC transporter ATP-binding protein [Candidatus Formimonas warabiya]|uniref:ABC transporter ATP-binding protein n=1 Tax=Formimonas warabiya TaxID=1761012 RepID=UPI0011D0CAF4|nr:oligopeptide/dipeptide ABC transporter ATP-binding protein [Candidatus Formimonas warabiya]